MESRERKLRRFAAGPGMCVGRAAAIKPGARETRTRETGSTRKTGRKQSGYAALCRELTRAAQTIAETERLSGSPVHTRQALRDLEGAWSRHFESLKETEVRRD